MQMLRIDAADFKRGLKTLEADILAVARQALGQSAAYAKELALRTTTFKDRTTNLRSSIRRGEKSTWSLFVRAGGASARYALFVEDGTREHVIVAKKAKALHFVWKGVPVFFKRVHHPGTKPTHFMLDARDAAEAKLAQFVDAGISRLVQ